MTIFEIDVYSLILIKIAHFKFDTLKNICKFVLNLKTRYESKVY
jgi:hypothetical protein